MPVSPGAPGVLPTPVAPAAWVCPEPLSGLVCSVRNNTRFVNAVAELARKADCKLTICPQAENRNDRWIQVAWPPGSASQDAGLYGEAGLSQPGGAGGLAGNIQENLGAVITLPRALLFLVLDLELGPVLQNVLETQEHTDSGLNTHSPSGPGLGTGLATHPLPLAAWTRGSQRMAGLSPAGHVASPTFLVAPLRVGTLLASGLHKKELFGPKC